MDLEQKVKQTISKYKLCGKKEKILVALSGGKDSAVVAYILKKLGYNIQGIYIDLSVGNYSKKCLEAVRKLCENLEINLSVYNLKKEQGKNMKYFWIKNKKLNHCAVCGIFKKWILNKQSRKLNVKKIATGHNLDDEIQTFLMNIMKGAPELSANIGPITKNFSDKKFIPRIKPLFFVPEKQIKKYAEKNKISFVKGKCPYAEESLRIKIRENLTKKLSDKQKQNLIKNFEKFLKRFREKKNQKINYCEICGEPARKNICKRCGLAGVSG